MYPRPIPLPQPHWFNFTCWIIYYFHLGDLQQLNIVYNEALLADAEKSADKNIRAQITATKGTFSDFSGFSMAQTIENNTIQTMKNDVSEIKPKLTINKVAIKPALKYERKILLSNM
jgi:hypothetical protein